jgi:hypothetical protein
MDDDIFLRIMSLVMGKCPIEPAMINFKSRNKLLINYTRSSISTYFLGGMKGVFSLLFDLWILLLSTSAIRSFCCLSGAFFLFFVPQKGAMIDSEGPPS